MSCGSLSASITATAGEQIEKEAKMQRPLGIKPGEYVVSTGGILQAQGVLMIFHTTPLSWPASQAEQKDCINVHSFSFLRFILPV